MLRAVTFDLWSTLIMESPQGSGWARTERIRRINEILNSERIPANMEMLGQAYKTVGERLEALWKTHRDIGVEEQVKMLLDLLPIGERILRSDSLMNRLIDAYTQPILSELPVPLEGAAEVLANLEARGLRLAVICNTGRTPGKILRIILERLDLLKHLSVQTFSDEVGLRKPRAEIFLRTLAALGVEPREALHIGDTLGTDVAGAIAVGMRAVHLCHARGADSVPSDGATIAALSELIPLIDQARIQQPRA
jgi:putative hydrolase of the HAD superfamily